MIWRSPGSAWLLGLCGLLVLGACNDNGEYKAPPRSVINMVTASGTHQILAGNWIGCVGNSPHPDTAIIWAMIGVSILVTEATFPSTDNTCQGQQTVLWDAIFVTSNAADQPMAGWSDRTTAPLASGPPKLDGSGFLPTPPTATVFDVMVVIFHDNTNPSVAPKDNSTFQMARLIDDTTAVQAMYGEIDTPSPACDPLYPNPPADPTVPYTAAGGCLYYLPYLLTQQP